MTRTKTCKKALYYMIVHQYLEELITREILVVTDSHISTEVGCSKIGIAMPSVALHDISLVSFVGVSPPR